MYRAVSRNPDQTGLNAILFETVSYISSFGSCFSIGLNGTGLQSSSITTGPTRMLGPDQLARLDAASKIDLGFPHDFLVRARSFIFGKTFPLIDNHRT